LVIRKSKLRPQRKKAVFKVNEPIKLDFFQEEAVRFLADGQNVLVAAPTGTGKTLIAEKLIDNVLASGRGCVYTSPIKALSNQKYRDFAARFGKEKVGLITGDISVNEKAPLLVMTTEIFRNWCFADTEMLNETTHVIFDELHYLDDMERGTAWEESIIFAPGHIRILGLSATVPNVYELASWIADIRDQQVKVIEEKHRAVPLELCWITPEGEVLNTAKAREHIKQRQERRRGRWTAAQNNGAESG